MSSHLAPVIAVDGPSGAGKGEVSLFLARQLGWRIMDSGALYRILAHQALFERVATDDPERLCELAGDLHEVDFRVHDERVEVFHAGRDVGDDIRREEVGVAASELAVWPEVRHSVVAAQRVHRCPPGLIADGRDMGTEVFPDALIKIFLDASVQARAQRRFEQLKALGFNANLDSLLRSIAQRDRKDRTRIHSPLVPAPDAVLIDTTSMLRETVKDHVLNLVRSMQLSATGFSRASSQAMPTHRKENS